jgi:hypothetical protein
VHATITTSTAPPQQFVERDVTITESSPPTAPPSQASVTLYNADDVIELVSIATTATDAAGNYEFTLTDAAPGRHTYVVFTPGDSTHAHAQSAEIVITYVTIPTTITATAAPLQQVIGHDVTITESSPPTAPPSSGRPLPSITPTMLRSGFS